MFMVDGLALSEAVQTTFITSGTATLLAMTIGVPLGAWCARQKRPSFQRLKTLITALYGPHRWWSGSLCTLCFQNPERWVHWIYCSPSKP